MYSYKEPTLAANFLLGTKPITNSILGFFGITDHYITVNKDLGKKKKEKTDLGLSSLGIPALKSGSHILPDDSAHRCRLQQKQTSGPQSA